MKSYDLAKKIVDRLNQEGYIAYFAGGWVRDFLMGHPSSDIDIATEAPPEKIVQLFKRTIQVGISFGVVVVVYEGHQFEVSTFRKDIDYQDGRRPNAIALSCPQQDALRRDFTINGMFYNPMQEKVIDYVQGKEDLERKVVRTIGDPNERFREDRLRMIRAVRFAYRFGFEIEEQTWLAIKEHARTLFPAVAIERVWQELKKMSEYPGFDQAILALHQLGLLGVIFPQLLSFTLEEIRERVASFGAFPKNTPSILYVMELFPKYKAKDLIEICLRLKLSKKDQDSVDMTCIVREALNEDNDDAFWTILYAQPSFDLTIKVVAARLPENERMELLKQHKIRQEKLKIHIERMQSNRPLVNSFDLKEAGIAPGKIMGKLLEEAKRLSINLNMHNKIELIEKLKKSEHWPRN